MWSSRCFGTTASNIHAHRPGLMETVVQQHLEGNRSPTHALNHSLGKLVTRFSVTFSYYIVGTQMWLGPVTALCLHGCKEAQASSRCLVSGPMLSLLPHIKLRRSSMERRQRSVLVSGYRQWWIQSLSWRQNHSWIWRWDLNLFLLGRNKPLPSSFSRQPTKDKPSFW